MTSRWQHSNIIQWIGRHALPLGLAAIFLQLAWRNTGLYPIVFADDGARAALNGIVHPAVRHLTTQRIAQATEQNPDAVVVYDVPLLVEGKLPHAFDLIVVAHAPAATRRERLSRSGE